MYAMEQDSTAVMEDELNVEEQKEKGNLKQEVMSWFKALADAYKRVKQGGSMEEDKPKTVGGVVYSW